MSEIIDPMELNAEEYEQAKADLMAESQGAPEHEEPEEEREEQESLTEEQPDERPLETPEEHPEIPPEESPEEPPEELFEIVYKGERKKLPKEKVIELAQKGFSYHSDMNRIAPHKKIVTLIEQDEDLANLVNNYVEERAKPKTSKLEDFETEEAWLEDNLKRVKKAEQFSQVQPPSPGQEIIEFFQTKDPENYEKVLGSLGQYAEQLTMAEYKKINESMDELEKFYDHVKQQIVPAQNKPRQTFRVRSGGGEPPRQGKRQQKVWEMSSKDFNQLIQKVKGY